VATDAEAICEARTRPTLRFVGVKDPEQQSVLVIHRTRMTLMRHRIELSNTIRAHMAEFGLVAPIGRIGLQGLVGIIGDLRAHRPDLTIHAGELAGPASVERSLELAPRGIGHGVRSLESPATLERLAREGVTLEVCPTSNRLLIPSALAALERAHGGHTPLRALQAAHVHCVLGSDDPTPMGTTFGTELEVATAAGVDLERLEADSIRRWTEITGAHPHAR